MHVCSNLSKLLYIGIWLCNSINSERRISKAKWQQCQLEYFLEIKSAQFKKGNSGLSANVVGSAATFLFQDSLKFIKFYFSVCRFVQQPSYNELVPTSRLWLLPVTIIAPTLIHPTTVFVNLSSLKSQTLKPREPKKKNVLEEVQVRRVEAEHGRPQCLRGSELCQRKAPKACLW